MPFFTNDSSSENEMTRHGLRNTVRRLYRSYTHKNQPKDILEKTSRLSQVTEETTESKPLMIEDVVNSIEELLKSREQEAGVTRPDNASLGTNTKGAKRVNKLGPTEDSKSVGDKKMYKSQTKGKRSKKGRSSSAIPRAKSQRIITQRSEIVKSNSPSVTWETQQKHEASFHLKKGDNQSRTQRHEVDNEYPGNIKCPTFDNLKELSHALKKLKRFEDKSNSEENGRIVQFAPRKLSGEEIDDLIQSSKISGCETASNNKIEDVLDRFRYLFEYLTNETHAPLRSRIIGLGTEMRQFADILTNSSSKLSQSSRSSKQAQIQQMEAFDLVCSNATLAFKDLSLKWAEGALEIEESLEQCRLLHDKTTRAYIAFYTWHCLLNVTPEESKHFHNFYGATDYRKSSTRILEKDYYTLLNDCLTELREALNYLLEKRSQLMT